METSSKGLFVDCSEFSLSLGSNLISGNVTSSVCGLTFPDTGLFTNPNSFLNFFSTCGLILSSKHTFPPPPAVSSNLVSFHLQFS